MRFVGSSGEDARMIEWQKRLCALACLQDDDDGGLGRLFCSRIGLTGPAEIWMTLFTIRNQKNKGKKTEDQAIRNRREKAVCCR